METKVPKKHGHKAGEWFTTQKPNSTDLSWASGLASGGGVGDALFFMCLFTLYAFVVGAYRSLLQLKPGSDKWDDYNGKVFAQVYSDELRFFTTVRSTSRVTMKPPAIIRPLTDLAKFETGMTSPLKLTLTFSDGLKVELYTCDYGSENSGFRDLLKSAVNTR